MASAARALSTSEPRVAQDDRPEVFHEQLLVERGST